MSAKCDQDLEYTCQNAGPRKNHHVGLRDQQLDRSSPFPRIRKKKKADETKCVLETRWKILWQRVLSAFSQSEFLRPQFYSVVTQMLCWAAVWPVTVEVESGDSIQRLSGITWLKPESINDQLSFQHDVYREENSGFITVLYENENVKLARNCN